VGNFLVLTVIGEDRPGLVETLSATVAAHGGNWLESRMARLAGRFAGLARVEVPAASAAALAAALEALEARGLAVVVESGAEGPARARPVRLDLVGADHPGILREVSRVLAGRRVNVEELTTECSDAPMGGQLLFRATALLVLPLNLEIEDLRSDLESIAADLMVDVTLEP